MWPPSTRDPLVPRTEAGSSINSGRPRAGGPGRWLVDPWSRFSAWLVLFANVLFVAGCNFGDGITPPPATLNLPIAVALSPAADDAAPRWLYVLNSNYTLRFNDGTLMSFDLDAIASALESCSKEAPCAFDDASLFLTSEVGVGSHGAALAVSPGGSRIYIPSRSRRNLTFTNWDEDAAAFRCQVDGDNESQLPTCAVQDADETVANERGLTFEGDPRTVATGRLADIGGGEGNFILLGYWPPNPNQDEGWVALFIDEEGAPSDSPPRLVDIARGFPPMVTLTLQPGTGIAWMTSASTDRLARVGVAVNTFEPSRPFLYDAGSIRLGELDTGRDSRDLKFDPARPQERAFVLTRQPEAVAELDLTREGLNARDGAIADVFEVAAGPSRLAVGRIGGRTYALATTFDGRKIYVIDVTGGAPVAVVGGFSGPFDLVVDAARELAYVVDFSLSVVRIVDLSPLNAGDAPYIRGTLGRPTPTKEFAN